MSRIPLDLKSKRRLALLSEILAQVQAHRRALKRQDILTLRQGAAKGRKVLYIWDRAGVDFRQWFRWEESGVYFLSREKENMKLEIVGIHPFDRTDPINQGVISDEMVATSVGVSVRRVIYRDPETGIIYTCLTNLPPAVPPGIVALLYKSRWDVEKVFDEFKNKLGEIKSWASTANAKTCLARLLCLTHNLMTLIEEMIFRETGIRNEAETKRKAQTLVDRDKDSKSKGCGGLTNLQKAIQRLAKRTVKFIRWLIFLGIPLLVECGDLAGLLNRWQTLPEFLKAIFLVAGFALSFPGLAAVRDLALSGDGTPVPLDPPRRLVTHGIYAFVRTSSSSAMPTIGRARHSVA